jgi:hypothetical protein
VYCYFLESGIPRPNLRLAQRVSIEGEFKALALSTLNAVADAILAEKLASQDEINSALARLAGFTDDPATVIGDLAHFPSVVPAGVSPDLKRNSERHTSKREYIAFLKDWPHWVRWPLVLPVAFAGWFLIDLGLYLVSPREGGIVWSVGHFLQAGVFVGIGAATAPHYRKVVGILLSLATMVTVIYFYLFGVAQSVESSLFLIPYLLGVGAGLFVAFDESAGE